MKAFGFLLLTSGLLLALAPAQAQGSTSFSLDGHNELYFALSGQTAHNPTLTVPANTEITITLKNVGDNVHNICAYDDNTCSDFVQADGDEVTFKFTSKAANGQYWCAPHKGSGMVGTLAVAGATTTTTATTPTGDGQKGSPGFEVVGLAIALVGGAILLARRK